MSTFRLILKILWALTGILAALAGIYYWFQDDIARTTLFFVLALMAKEG